MAILLTAVDGSFDNPKVETVQLPCWIPGPWPANCRHILLANVRDRIVNRQLGLGSEPSSSTFRPHAPIAVQGTHHQCHHQFATLPTPRYKLAPDGKSRTCPRAITRRARHQPELSIHSHDRGVRYPNSGNLHWLAGQVLHQDFALTRTCAVWEDDVEGGSQRLDHLKPVGHLPLKSHSDHR